MVIEMLLCRRCRSQNVIKHGRDKRGIKHGRDKRGIQRFLCHDCHATFQKAQDDRGYTEDFKSQVLAAYQERASMRGISRVFGISRETLADWLKKSRTPAASEQHPASGG